MLDELTLILIKVGVVVVCARTLYFIEWFDKRDGEGWNG